MTRKRRTGLTANRKVCGRCGAKCGVQPVMAKGGVPLCGPCGRAHKRRKRKGQSTTKPTDAIFKRLPGHYGAKEGG